MRNIVLLLILVFCGAIYGQNVKQKLEKDYKWVYELKSKNGKVWYKVSNDYHEKAGLYDDSGKKIFSCLYDWYVIHEDDEGNTFIEVGKDISNGTQKGVFDVRGKNLIKFDNYKDIFINGGYMLLKKTNENVVADYFGKIICVSEIPVYLAYGKDCRYGIYRKGGKFGIISRNPLRILTQPKYDGFLFLFDETGAFLANVGAENKDLSGLLPLKSGGKWGIVDCEGNEIGKPQYDNAQIAANNIYTVAEGGKWGLIDNKGNILMPCEYDEPIIFKSDVAMVKKDGEVKIIKNPLVENAAVSIAANAAPSNKKNMGGPVVSRYPSPDSDVDKDIPQASRKNENLFAFVVANENYPDAPVPYALNDGRMFAEYCEKALGIPKKNINMYEDATYGNIITMMDKIKSIAKAYEGDAAVIVYYAGHGFPDEKQSTAYLLPIDGSGSEITTTGYSLAHLYDELSKLPLRDAIVFLDACFSGAKREDDMLAQSRGVAIKVKNEQPKGNLLVFTAAQGDETAHQMEEKHHGLFTYFLLKGMQQLKGNANLGDLTDFVTKNVKRQSVVINNKRQTPTVIPSPTMTDTWRSNTMCSK